MQNLDEDKKDEKEIEIVSGNGSEIDISPVYEHLNSAKHKEKENKPKNIIIPEVKHNKQ